MKFIDLSKIQTTTLEMLSELYDELYPAFGKMNLDYVHGDPDIIFSEQSSAVGRNYLTIVFPGRKEVVKIYIFLNPTMDEMVYAIKAVAPLLKVAWSKPVNSDYPFETVSTAPILATKKDVDQFIVNLRKWHENLK